MNDVNEKLKAISNILEEALSRVREGDLDGAEEVINKIEKVSSCPLCLETQVFFLSLIYVAKFPLGDDEIRKKRLEFLINELEYLVKELGGNDESIYGYPC